MKPKTSRKPQRKEFALPGRVVQFPQVRGKRLEAIEFATNTEYHAIELRFQDKTELYLEIEPCFTFHANYTDWKIPEGRLIKQWRVVRSQSSKL